MSVDPISIIGAIGTGLKLVDEFVDMVRKRKTGKAKGPPPSVHAVAYRDRISLVPTERGIEIARARKERPPPEKPIATAADLKLNEWDQTVYDTLWSRVRTNWKLYHGLYAQEPLAPPETKVRLKVQMEKIKGELCTDFSKIVAIYERTLGVALPDHYSLYDECG